MRALADGFNDEAWVTHIATPLIEALYLDIVWPTAVATLAGTTMVVRYTTDQKSPLAMESSPVGYRVPVLTTSVGLAYLAHCARRDCAPSSKRWRRATSRPTRSRATRRRSSVCSPTSARAAMPRGSAAPIPKTSSIAVPVLRQGQALASINITWINSALTLADVVQRYLPALRRTARAIEERLDMPVDPSA